MTRFTETKDDHALRFLEPVNRLRPGASMQANRTRSHLTLVLSIKTAGRFVNPPYGLRIKRPFINEGWDILKVLWWKPLGLMTYYDARKRTLKYLDQINRLLHRHEPIVAIRATLIDWSTGKPIPRKILRDPWWYERTFSGWVLNEMRLRAWGMSVNDGFRPKYDVTPSAPLNRTRDDSTTLEGAVDFNVDQSLLRAINAVISEIPRWILARSVMQTKDKRFSPTALRRVVVTVRTAGFRQRLRTYIENLYITDADFAAKLGRSQARLALEKAAEHWVRDEINNRILPTEK